MAFGGQKRVLLAGGEGIVLYAPSGRGVERETSIAWEVPDFGRQLVEVLTAEHQGKPVLVLFDGADQAYRKEENIPKLSPFDRPRFVKRKLELAFPSYPIRAALDIKPKKPKGAAFRLEMTKAAVVPPSYLFAALPETDMLDRVGDALFESGVPVAGFGLLPVESVGLVSEIAMGLFGKDGKNKKDRRRASRWAALIGQHETGGLRQIVIRDGNLALTRLSPTSEAGTSGAGWAEEAMKGFRETLAYVTRLGYTQDDGIDVAVVCGDIEKQFFDGKSLPVTNFRCINTTEALALIGARTFGLEKSNFADPLHAAWAGKKRGLTLPVQVPSIHRVMAPRLGARIASGALLLSALGLGGLAASDYQAYLSVQGELEGKRNQLALMQREYEEESKAFDALPVRPDAVKSVLEIKKQLEAATANPAPTLNTLKGALGSDVVLNDFTFEHIAPAGSLLAEGKADGAPAPGGAEDRGAVRMAFSFSLPAVPELENKVTRAEQLLADLQAAFPAWNVAIAAQFGNVSRSGSFEGAADGAAADAQGRDGEARFTLEGPL